MEAVAATEEHVKACILGQHHVILAVMTLSGCQQPLIAIHRPERGKDRWTLVEGTVAPPAPENPHEMIMGLLWGIPYQWIQAWYVWQVGEIPTQEGSIQCLGVIIPPDQKERIDRWTEGRHLQIRWELLEAPYEASLTKLIPESQALLLDSFRPWLVETLIQRTSTQCHPPSAGPPLGGLTQDWNRVVGGGSLVLTATMDRLSGGVVLACLLALIASLLYGMSAPREVVLPCGLCAITTFLRYYRREHEAKAKTYVNTMYYATVIGCSIRSNCFEEIRRIFCREERPNPRGGM